MNDAPRPSLPPTPATPPPHESPRPHAERFATGRAPGGARELLALAGLAMLPWVAEHALRPPPSTVVMILGALPAPGQTAAAVVPSAAAAPIAIAPAALPAPAASSTPSPAPAAPVVAVSPQRSVLIRWGTGWYPGTVLRNECQRYVRIQFTGYGPEWEEIASLEDLRDPSQGATTVPEERSAEGPTLDPQDRLTRGMALDALYGSTWYPVHVLSVHGDTVRVHYDGYEARWDEDMSRDRLRRRGVGDAQRSEAAPGGVAVDGQTTLLEGQRVWVRSGSNWHLSRVVSGECNGLVRVHYLGWSNTWDEVVPRDRMLLPGSRVATPPQE
jgi:hypothetical protein